MTTWLSAHFALEELAGTLHRGIDNRPPPDVAAMFGMIRFRA